MKHQHGRESAGMIFIARFMNSFLHQASFAKGYWCYDRHRSVRLVVLVGLAIDQIAQSGLSSLSVIYYSAKLFSRVFSAPFFSPALPVITFTCYHNTQYSAGVESMQESGKSEERKDKYRTAYSHQNKKNI